MATDRESTIRRAEKLLKQGRLEAAIAEYVQAVEDQPRDWNTVNVLGDLYVKAGQVESAVTQYTRVAAHFAREGFLQKAAALYKKIAKIKPQDEGVLLRLADLSEQQGLLADAKSCLGSVAEHRRRRGDRKGAAEIILRLAKLDPGDVNASVLAARAAVELGDTGGAVDRFKAAGEELLRRNRTKEGLKALAEAAALDPSDTALRRSLADGNGVARQVPRARELAGVPDDDTAVAAAAEALATDVVYSSRAVHKAEKGREPEPSGAEGAAGVDTPLLHAERELRAGRYESGRAILDALVAEDGVPRDALFSLGQTLIDVDADAAFVCVDLASDAAVAADGFEVATSALGAFIRRVPDHVAALMKLIEVSVDGGLDATMYAAQAQLADAYLATDRAADARVIAEDLVAREPWQRTNIDRLRRALVALGEPEPDQIIADYLSGASPLALTELWEEAGRDTGGHPQTVSPGEPLDEPLPGRLQDDEIELDFRGLGESTVLTEAGGEVETVFDTWLDSQSDAETPAAQVPGHLPESAPSVVPSLNLDGAPSSLLLDRPFEDLLEAAPEAEASVQPGTEPPSPVSDSAVPEAGVAATAPAASAGPAVVPGSAFEPEPADVAAESVPANDLPDGGLAEPPATTAENQREPIWQAAASDEDLQHDVSAEQLLRPLEVQPVWDWVEPGPDVEVPGAAEAEPLAPPRLLQSFEDLLDLAPAVAAPPESVSDLALPTLEPSAETIAEPLPACVDAAERPTSIPPAPAEFAIAPAEEPEAEPSVSPAAEPPSVAADLSDLEIVAVPEPVAAPAAESVGMPAETLPDSAERPAGPAQEPDVEPIPELLATALPSVEALVEPMAAVDATADAETRAAAVAGSDDVRFGGVAGVPGPEQAPVAAASIAERADWDFGASASELPAVFEADAAGRAASGQQTVAQADDLDRVFEMFRDEAALRGLADMGAQHLKLAAAYRDIGMMDECLGALEVAAHSPRHRFEAASLLAETLRDQGRTREAIEWFERAAEAPAPGAEAGRRLLYELGKTLSDVGESERALAVFLELQADAPDYRDIAIRVRRLSSAT